MISPVRVETLVLVVLSVTPASLPFSVSDLLDAYAANEDQVKSWVLKCEQSSEFAGGQADGRSARAKRICDLRADGVRVSSRCTKWQEVTKGATSESGWAYLSLTWDGDRYIAFRKTDPNKPGYVSIDGMQRMDPAKKEREINSLLYGHDAAVLMGFYPGTFERVDTILRKAHAVSVRATTEAVGGNNCRVIDARTASGNYTIWIDPTHGFNIAKVRIVRSKREGHLYNGTGVRADSSFVLENVRFQEVQGAWVAMEAGFRTLTAEAGGKPGLFSAKTHVKITEITLNPDHDSLHSFTGGDIPNGTQVFVAPVTHIRYLWTDAKLVTKVDERVVGKIDGIVARLDSWRKAPALWGSAEANEPSSLEGADGAAAGAGPGTSEPNSEKDDTAKDTSKADPHAIILPSPYCGVYCLYAALKWMGRDLDFRDLVKVEYVGTADGSTMAELSEAAREEGLFAGVAARLTTRGLRQCPYPALLHVKADWRDRKFDHYELFLGTEGGQAKLFDPPRAPRLVPFAELAGRWDGYALALSDRPFDIEAIFGPDRQRLMLYGALGVLVLLSVFLLRSRVSRLDWASTRTQRLRLSVGQAGALAFAALASGVVYHVANREGFVANAKTTTLFQEAYRGVFIPRIGVGQVRKLLGTDTLFIDARYREDFDARHLPGAISLPIDVNEATWRKITDPLPKDSQIIVYCQSARCKFAEHAGSQLVKDGFSRVSILRGGWSEWAARNADRVQGRVGKEDGANPNGLPRQSAGAGPGA